MSNRPGILSQYRTSAIRIGEVVTCRYRDRECRITSITDAPIPWPRCQPFGERGGSGLWVNGVARMQCGSGGSY